MAAAVAFSDRRQATRPVDSRLGLAIGQREALSVRQNLSQPTTLARDNVFEQDRHCK